MGKRLHGQLVSPRVVLIFKQVSERQSKWWQGSHLSVTTVNLKADKNYVGLMPPYSVTPYSFQEFLEDVLPCWRNA
jgi:hypothetical protein